ncbi:MAG: hypothetical protein AB8B97_22110 [Granulosicoccus sp.]
MNNNIAGLAIVALTVVSGTAVAEPFGLLNGRSALISSAPERSFEVGAVFSELSFDDGDDADYEHFGARYNYKINPTSVIYGDVGQSTLEDGSLEADGLTFGIGGFWQMDGVFSTSNFAVHASFHRVDLDFSNRDNDLTGNTIIVEGLFSGKEPINQAGTMYFNGSIGISRQSLKITLIDDASDTDTELTWSAGVVVDTQSKTGEFYGGVFYIDEIGFGAGYRHFLQ